VVFFDVGQGDSALIRTEQNHHILIDGGYDETVLEKLGRELPFFDNTIDLVVLTHTHNDHVGGLFEVIERYEVKDIICTGSGEDSGVTERWQEILEEEGYRQARAGKSVSAEGFRLDVLYPAEELREDYVSDSNEISVMSRAVLNGDSFFFTGDAYTEQEQEVLFFEDMCEGSGEAWCLDLVLDSDILKVGHHGSRTSTSEEFLSRVSPSVAIISAGEDNHYGHPHREVVERLEEYEVEVLRTDRHGDIRIIVED